MPQAKSFTISDGATPAVTHTFSPAAIKDALSTFYNASDSVKLANREAFTCSVRPATASAPAKIVVKLDLPVEVTVDGVSKRAENNLYALDCIVSQESTKSARKARRILLANLLLSPEFAAVHDDVEAFI
jgi:hypothetical protein